MHCCFGAIPMLFSCVLFTVRSALIHLSVESRVHNIKMCACIIQWIYRTTTHPCERVWKVWRKQHSLTDNLQAVALLLLCVCQLPVFRANTLFHFCFSFIHGLHGKTNLLCMPLQSPLCVVLCRCYCCCFYRYLRCAPDLCSYISGVEKGVFMLVE